MAASGREAQGIEVVCFELLIPPRTTASMVSVSKAVPNRREQLIAASVSHTLLPLAPQMALRSDQR